MVIYIYICKWSNSASVRLKKGWGPSCAKRGTSSLPHQGGSTAPELKNDELLPVDVRICKISRKTIGIWMEQRINDLQEIFTTLPDLQSQPPFFSMPETRQINFKLTQCASTTKISTVPVNRDWFPWGFFWCWTSALQTDEWHKKIQRLSTPWEALSSNDINAQCIRTHLGNSIFYMHSFVSHVYSQAFAGRLVSHLES